MRCTSQRLASRARGRSAARQGAISNRVEKASRRFDGSPRTPPKSDLHQARALVGGIGGRHLAGADGLPSRGVRTRRSGFLGKARGRFQPPLWSRGTTTGAGSVTWGRPPERGSSGSRISSTPSFGKLSPARRTRTGTGARGSARGSSCAAEVGRRHPARSQRWTKSSTSSLATTRCRRDG